jgi:hypothetical protein
MGRLVLPARVSGGSESGRPGAVAPYGAKTAVRGQIRG